MINSRFTLFGKEVKLTRNIVKDYETLTGEPLTKEIIEHEIRLTPYEDFIDIATPEQMTKIAERTMRDIVYEPYVALPLYNNTRIVIIDKRKIHLYTNAIPFTAKHIENLLYSSEYYDKVTTMSNKELSKAVEIEMMHEAYLVTRLPELQTQMEEEWKTIK